MDLVCGYIAAFKHEGGQENSRKLCKPESTNFKRFEAAGTSLELDGSQGKKQTKTKETLDKEKNK